jgi:hypothetical protein
MWLCLVGAQANDRALHLTEVGFDPVRVEPRGAPRDRRVSRRPSRPTPRPEVDGHRDVVGGGTGIQPVEKPESFLGERYRRDYGARLGVHDACRVVAAASAYRSAAAPRWARRSTLGLCARTSAPGPRSSAGMASWSSSVACDGHGFVDYRGQFPDRGIPEHCADGNLDIQGGGESDQHLGGQQ